MRNPVKVACLLIVLCLSIQACDININTSNVPSVPPVALTITAQAAILQQGNQQPANLPNVSPTAANVNPPAQANPNSPASTNTPAPANAAAATNTPIQAGPVTAKVTVETNCRSGPGLIYKSIYSMSVSDVAEVVGKNTLTSYWIIKIPNGGGATCWLWGQYAVLTGNTATLVEFATPTPLPVTATKTSVPTATVVNTPTSAASAAPSNVQATLSCVDQGNGTNKVSATIAWADNSNGELGFAVLAPSIADAAPANTTSHNVNFIIPKNQSFQLGVQTLANSGNSSAVWITGACP